MFSWGEDCQRGFYLKDGSSSDGGTADGGVHYLNISYNITDLSAGHNVLAFVKSNGNAFIIRTNESRDGRRVRGRQKFVKYKEKFEAVSCGDDVVALLSDSGKVLCVDTTQSPFIPRPLEAFSNKQVSQIACGSQHSVALTKGGQLYTWGQDCRGQLGLGTRKSGCRSPQHVRSLSTIPVIQVAAGGDQSFALSVSGGVFSWGRNDCGQLGLGDIKDRHTPVSVHCLNRKKAHHISCGQDHTAILTKHGAVFTFGSGQHGQLGHNSRRNELHPRLVAELWGAKVTKIACGRNHTLVLTDSKKVYSFGCGEQGQLGHGASVHPTVPLPVHLSQATSEPKIKNIFAGENCSFATCSSDEDAHEGPNTHCGSVTQHGLDDKVDKWTSECDSKSWKKIKQEIYGAFSSASCLNNSFLEQSDQHFQTSPKYPGLNLKHARLAFRKLVKKASVRAEIEAAVLHLLPFLDKKPVGVEGLRIYLLLNELLHAIQKHMWQWSTKLAEVVATAVTSLSKESLQIIGDWWCSLSPSTMIRHVKVWKTALSEILSFQPVPRNSGVRNLLLVLQYMYNANSRVAESRRIPESDFCLSTDETFLSEDLHHWHLQSQRKHAHAEPLLLCNFPIVMDLQSKKTVFDMNAFHTKLTEVEDVLLNFWWTFVDPPVTEVYFVVNLRRASVLEDTIKKLADTHHRDYKRPLMVFFDENHEIDDVYKKDFFYEVFHDLVSAESGMFMFNESETLAWFSSKGAQEDQRYFLFGVLCGLALYNDCIIHLPFPLVLFKKLLGVRPSLEDLIEFSPSVGESLKYILDDYKDDDLEDLYMYFSINWDGKDIDLDPQNPEKLVTSQNKKEYVDAYVNHAFNTSVESVFQEFRRGFFLVCERDLVRLFRPKELQEVMVGKDFNDWEKLKQNTVYKGGYAADHPTIQMFWEVFDELTEIQKQAFLWFVTGFDRVPTLGTDKIKMQVKVKEVTDLSPDRYYPETHTCFSTLELPLYSAKEIMQTKLTEALSNNKRIYK
ncbi:probable E3 ubiquitin-protein ligase HERC4 isoform X2 [Archocentrus centrarchus]|uniref:probable E3 ubiquitin-protein ligase HERC4 isoform X2 n=1 Tax=Archocentrus centrarchus TaxID=63155 RepID=UPI0011E9BB55|nr:probable E3 ubiquitin-protein ligase HERC4 isoform X2 [Archocentrus centrarchus]